MPDILEFRWKDVDEELETIGTKQKFWISGKTLLSDDSPYLVKLSTDNRPLLPEKPNIIPIVGEHWSEYIASQLCKVLDLPHASYQICRVLDNNYPEGFKWGVISKKITNEYEEIILGNQFLFNELDNYPAPDSNEAWHKRYKNSQHTIEVVFEKISNANIKTVPNLEKELGVCDLFCGYLLLDVLIGNQDRHHENWAIIQAVANSQMYHYLCPTYDHAASLGRNDSNDKKEKILKNQFGFNIDGYVKAAKSAFYSSQLLGKKLTTLEAYHQAIIQPSVQSNTHQYWLNKLRALIDETIENIINPISPEVMSDISKQFAIEMIKANKNRLLQLKIDYE